MTKLFIFLLLLISIDAISQADKAKIHASTIDAVALEELVLQKVNKLRDSLKLKTLVKDKILNKAALDQSDYQLMIKRLTHKQKTWNKKTPFDRVAYYEGTHSLVGENCAFTFFNKSVRLKKVKKAVYINSQELIAEAIFNSWKHSPGHYANMVNPDYVTTGINFAIDPKTNKIYATQVFGGTVYKAPAGIELTKNAHGITKGTEKQCAKTKAYKYGSEFFANYTINEKGEVYLYFHDLNYFKNILSGVNDAVAVDIIKRDQLPCGGANIFHGNPVHDGIMQKPIYYYELYKNNEATQDNYLLTKLGTVPKALRGEYQVNTMVIKNNKLCYTSYPVSVPQGQIPLFPFKPLFDSARTATILPDTINKTLTFYIPFNRGEINYDSRAFKTFYNRVSGYKNYITAINVNSYSSVEGSVKQNQYLQTQRLNKIIKTIKSTNIPASVPVKGKAQENWDLFYKQIDNPIYGFLKDKSKSEVKAYFNDKNNLMYFDAFLKAQRTAVVTVSINGVIDANTNESAFDLSLAYQNKLMLNQTKQANAIMSKVLRDFDYKSDFPYDLFYSDSIAVGNSNLISLTNQWAMLLNIDWFNITKKEGEEGMKLASETKHYVPFQYNMYCSAVKYMFNEIDTIGSTSDLLGKIQALKKHKSWGKYSNQISNEEYNRLIINYHLGLLKVNRRYRRYGKVDESLKVIKNYFVKADMTLVEAKKMALFFNEYYRFDWSVEILKPYMDKEGEIDEDALFVFVKTASLLRDDFTDDDYFKYMSMAQAKNNKRFCAWLNKDFQLLRSKKTKEVYCKVCK